MLKENREVLKVLVVLLISSTVGDSSCTKRFAQKGLPQAMTLNITYLNEQRPGCSGSAGTWCCL